MSIHIALTMLADRTLSVGPGTAGIDGENNATVLDVTVPAAYAAWYKYIDIEPADGSGAKQYGPYTTAAFEFALPLAVLSEGRMLLQVVLKTGAVVIKSYPVALVVDHGINGTEATITNNPDVIQSLIERTEAAEAKASAATDAAEDATEAVDTIPTQIETHNTSGTSHQDIREDISTVEAIARGRALARVFDEYADMTAWLAVPENVATLNTGDNLYIRDTGVPDYWWDGTAASELEAEAPSLVDYYTKSQVDALLPITITQSEYDALVAAGTDEAGRIYYVVPDAE